MKPILSFCIPTWNRAQTVFECVRNILNYQGEEIEVVVSNNASTDETLDLLSTIDDKRLKVFSNKDNIRIYNWPLAISRANGMWSALMSDEDVVITENIELFIGLLRKLNKVDVGLVYYRFPPVTLFDFEYTSSNVCESLKLVLFFGGQITGSIVNMRYFQLRNPLEDYGIEPQFYYHLDTARIARLHITKFSLISFGKEEKIQNRTDFIDAGFFGGLGLRYRLKRAEDVLGYISKLDFKEKEIIKLVFSSFYVDCMFLSSLVAMFLTSSDEEYERNFVIKAAKKYYKLSTRDDARNRLQKYIDDLVNIVIRIIGLPYVIEKIQVYQRLMKLYFNGNIECDYRDGVDGKDLNIYEKVYLGDLIFNIHRNFYRDYEKNSMFREMKYVKDSSDYLKFSDTEDMFRLLNYGDYHAVVRYPKLKTIRDSFIRGKAYFLLNDFQNAQKYLEQFIAVIENSKNVADIITGAYSVYSAYDYLAKIAVRNSDYIGEKECLSKRDAFGDILLNRYSI